LLEPAKLVGMFFVALTNICQQRVNYFAVTRF